MANSSESSESSESGGGKVQQQYTEHEILAVFDDPTMAQAVAKRVVGLGVPESDVHVGDRRSEVAALRAEMREETDNVVVGPGNFGPFTKEMTKGVVFAVVVGSVIGFAVCTPLGFIEFAPLSLVARLIIAAVVGVFTGATVGFVVGGGLGAKGPRDTLAAERGVPVSVRTPDRLAQDVVRIMREAQPIRLDLGSIEGNPVQTIETEGDRARSQ